MGSPASDSIEIHQRRAAEERWRARVLAAKLRFDFAVAQMEQALRCPGAGAIERALETESRARAEYQNELRIFTDMVVRGKLPEQES